MTFVFGKQMAVWVHTVERNPVWVHEEQTTSIYKPYTSLHCHPLALFLFLFIKSGVNDAKHLTLSINITENRRVNPRSVCSQFTLPGLLIHTSRHVL